MDEKRLQEIEKQVKLKPMYHRWGTELIAEIRRLQNVLENAQAMLDALCKKYRDTGLEE